MWNNKHNVNLLNKLNLEFRIYKKCNGTKKGSYTELLRQTKEKFEEHISKNDDEINIGEMKHALLLQKRINDEKKNTSALKGQYFLTALIVPLFSAFTFFGTTMFSISSARIINSIEDGMEKLVEINKINDARNIVFNTQTWILNLVFYVMISVIVIMFVLSHLYYYYSYNPKRNAFYSQYIEDCIIIIKEMEQKPKIAKKKMRISLKNKRSSI